jgi:hypothetical protein
MLVDVVYFPSQAKASKLYRVEVARSSKDNFMPKYMLS